MTFAEKSTDGVFNGATIVTIVAAPASSHTSVVRKLTLYNADTVAHDFTLNYNNNGTRRTLAFWSQVPPKTSVFYEVIEVLDSTLKLLDGQIEGAHTTTAPSFVGSYGDVS